MTNNFWDDKPFNHPSGKFQSSSGTDARMLASKIRDFAVVEDTRSTKHRTVHCKAFCTYCCLLLVSLSVAPDLGTPVTSSLFRIDTG